MDAEKTGAYLAMLRKARGMTQQEIADQLGVSNKTISKWESGGGFPDITVLPALAELYGVTADDILAGQTLTGRTREKTDTQAMKKRLLARLRTRSDVCFILALALCPLVLLKLPYISILSLPLSVAVGWVGYVLVSHPIRYGGVEADGTLWQDLIRKLLAVSLLQWGCFLQILILGQREVDFENWDGVVRGSQDHWKPLLFLLGALAILWGFRTFLRRRAGADVRLLPKGAMKLLPWLIWGLLFFACWQVADSRFQEAVAPWIQRYGEDVLTGARFDNWPKLRAQRDAELLPLLHIRRAVTAAGGISGLGLLAVQLLSHRKKRKDGLAVPEK